MLEECRPKRLVLPRQREPREAARLLPDAMLLHLVDDLVEPPSGIVPSQAGKPVGGVVEEVLHGAKSGESLTLNGAHPILHGVGR